MARHAGTSIIKDDFNTTQAENQAQAVTVELNLAAGTFVLYLVLWECTLRALSRQRPPFSVASAAVSPFPVSARARSDVIMG